MQFLNSQPHNWFEVITRTNLTRRFPYKPKANKKGLLTREISQKAERPQSSRPNKGKHNSIARFPVRLGVRINCIPIPRRANVGGTSFCKALVGVILPMCRVNQGCQAWVARRFQSCRGAYRPCFAHESTWYEYCGFTQSCTRFCPSTVGPYLGASQNRGPPVRAECICPNLGTYTSSLGLWQWCPFAFLLPQGPMALRPKTSQMGLPSALGFDFPSS